MIDVLNSALEKLTQEEQDIIEKIQYNEESTRLRAKIHNLSQPAIVKKKNKILDKLKKFLDEIKKISKSVYKISTYLFFIDFE